MSITITTDVFCDVEGCDVGWVHGVVGHAANSRAARAVARRLGWTHVDGKDYCPEHSPA